MRRAFRAEIAAAVIGGGTVLLAPAAAFAASPTCNGDLSGTVTGNVTVLSGANCNIQEATITGSVVVLAGGAVIIGSGSTVAGNVTTTNAGSTEGPFGYAISVLVCNTTIGGSVNVSGSTANASSATTRIAVPNTPEHDACPIGSCGTGGNVVVNNNTGVTHNDPVAAEVTSNVLAGNLSCSGNAGGVELEGGNTVAGLTTGQCVPVF